MKAIGKLKSLLVAKRARRKPPAYEAVIVRSLVECCKAALETVNHPILQRERPNLPLPSCTMPDRCLCRIRERPDRRIGERRLARAVKLKSATFEASKRETRDRRK